VLLGGWRRLWLRTVECEGGIDRVRKQVKKRKMMMLRSDGKLFSDQSDSTTIITPLPRHVGLST